MQSMITFYFNFILLNYPVQGTRYIIMDMIMLNIYNEWKEISFEIILFDQILVEVTTTQPGVRQ